LLVLEPKRQKKKPLFPPLTWPQVPYDTKVVTLGIGQRTDVIVTANGNDAAYWMRSNISQLCSLPNQPNALAVIYYDTDSSPQGSEMAGYNRTPTGYSTSATPTSTPWNIPDPGTCANDDLNKTVPYYAITPTTNPATTQNIEINSEVNDTGHFLWTMNNQSFRANYNNPVLLLANQGNTSYPDDPQWNVYNFGSNSSIRVHVTNPTTVAHPM
jgi:hypothetical protein